MPNEKPTASERYRTWVRDEVASKASFKIPEIVRKAERHFKKDADFLAEYAKDAIRGQMYVDAQHVVAESRAVIIGGAHLDPDRLQEAADRAARSVWGRWETCFEHVGGRHVLVLDMKDEDLATAESERFESAESHARWGRFFARIRKGMKRGKKVRDCYTTKQLDELWHEVTDDTEQKGAA